MYELLDQHRIMEPTILDDVPNLKDFLDRFEALPQIKSYMESPKFMKAPLNGPMAAFGNK
jgi:glutathione S-transferase